MDETDRPATSEPVAAAPSATPYTEVGATPEDRDIRFELVLAYPGREAMQAYALAVADPTSADFRHYLSAAEIGERFGLGDTELETVSRWATEHGLTVVGTSPQRTAISVVAPAVAVEVALEVVDP